MVEGPSNIRVVPEPLQDVEVYIRAGERLMLRLAQEQKEREAQMAKPKEIAASSRSAVQNFMNWIDN